MYLLKKIIGLLFLASMFSCATSGSTVKAKKVNVGVYSGAGAGEISVIETLEALKIDSRIIAFPITASDINSGKLSKIDALIFPGGSGSKQLKDLGEQGKTLVSKFLKEDGKGIVGICAGDYMLCSTPTYTSLGLADVKHIRENYDRGRGLVHFKLSATGKKIFPELKNENSFVQYYDGPVMIPLGNSTSFQELGTYGSDIHIKEGTPKGVTPGKTFIFNEEVGNGRIFGIAGHAESTLGMRFMVPRMVRWVTKTTLVPYDNKWVNQNKNKKDIIFNSKLQTEESKLKKVLFEGNSNDKLSAMYRLFKMRSRPAVRWFVKLLKDKNPKVRSLASGLLAQSEYTHAIKDLKEVLIVETDEETKYAIKKAIEVLKI